MIKIGYTPYSKELDAPGDRRRLIFYSKLKGMPLEIADPRIEYDILYLTSPANLSQWITYKQIHKNVKIIFEIVDAYMLDDKFLWTYFRGFYRYLLNRESKLILNYKKMYNKLFSISDVVVCSTNLQKNFISKYNKNVHISLDFFDDDIRAKKTNYSVHNPFTLVWEGMSYSVKNILSIQNVLENHNNIKLKIITDKELPYLGFFTQKTANLFKHCKFDIQMIEWNKDTFVNEIINADLAIIPIDKNDKLSYLKPENKLLLFWKIGIPVLTSDTPAYTAVHKAIGSNLYCKNSKEWSEKLDLFINGEIDLVQYMEKTKKYLENFHSKEIILEKWDKIFKSINIELR